MKITTAALLWFVVTLYSGVAFAQTLSNCDDPSSSQLTRVYYINGTGTKYKEDAEELAAVLDGILPNTFDVGLSFNAGSKVHFYVDVLEAYLQKQAETDADDLREFWTWMNNGERPPGWFLELIVDKLWGASGSVATDMVENQYLRDLKAGKKVIIVGHSQGSLHANFAYEHIRLTYPEYIDSIGIVAIGSVANEVKGGGLYINNPNDKVIYEQLAPILEEKGFDYLPPNPANRPFTSPLDPGGHFFEPTYVAGFTDYIQYYVNLVAENLDFPVKADICKPGGIRTESISTSAITYNNATLKAYITSGTDVDYWFMVKEGSSPAACSTTESGYGGVGVVSQGQYVYDSSDNYVTLYPNRRYYYRACAKDQSADVHDGVILNFRTKNQVATNVDTSVSDVQATTAYLNGTIHTGNSIDAWFTDVFTSSGSPNCSSSQDGMGPYNSGDTFPRKYVRDLQPATTYYYRFCGKGYDGLNQELVSFTTESVTTDVNTGAVASLSSTSVTLEAYVYSGYNIDVWMARSTSGSPSCYTSDQNFNGYGVYSTGDTAQRTYSVNPDTRYYYRACGKGNDGSVNESPTVYNFKTPKDGSGSSTGLGVITHSAYDRGQTQATLKGFVSEGSDIGTYFSVQQQSGFANCSNGNAYLSGTYDAGQYFSGVKTGLAADTTYYYRACGNKNGKTVSGEGKSFRTLPYVRCGQTFSGSSSGMSMTVTPESRFRTAHLQFNAFQIPDRLDIYNGSQTLSTGGLVSGIHPYQFGINGRFRFVVTGNSDPATRWDLTVNCYE